MQTHTDHVKCMVRTCMRSGLLVLFCSQNLCIYIADVKVKIKVAVPNPVSRRTYRPHQLKMSVILWKVARLERSFEAPVSHALSTEGLYCRME